MSAERLIYLDSSAIVKLAVDEAETPALRARLRRRRALVSSRVANVEVARALGPLGQGAVDRGEEVLGELELVRINDRVLAGASSLPPAELRTLDAIHLATALLLGSDLRQVITYDQRMARAARSLGLAVDAPA
jgi:uncharacterized protein